MSEQIKLRECPFCGCSEIEYDNCDRGTGQWFVCSHCGVRMDFSYGEDATNRWNTRTEDKRIEKALEEIEKINDSFPIRTRRESWFSIQKEMYKIKSILKGEV